MILSVDDMWQRDDMFHAYLYLQFSLIVTALYILYNLERTKRFSLVSLTAIADSCIKTGNRWNG